MQQCNLEHDTIRHHHGIMTVSWYVPGVGVCRQGACVGRMVAICGCFCLCCCPLLAAFFPALARDAATEATEGEQQQLLNEDCVLRSALAFNVITGRGSVPPPASDNVALNGTLLWSKHEAGGPM